MHTFLFSWLKDGEEMWLAGPWTEAALERLYVTAERLRAGAVPAIRGVGGRGVRVLRQQEQRWPIACGRS